MKFEFNYSFNKSVLKIFLIIISFSTVHRNYAQNESDQESSFCNEQPCGIQANTLVWFRTEQEAECSPKGFWADCGPDIIPMYERDDCANYVEHGSSLLSMNYNPALYFGQSEKPKEYEFRLKSNEKVDITVIAVLVPRIRIDPNDEEYGLLLPEYDRVRSLSIDSMRVTSPVLFNEEHDYGDHFGSDLFIFNDLPKEVERYGKIVTYQTTLKPNRNILANDMIQEIFKIYSHDENENTYQQHGQVPEFIVFNKVLNELERLKAETYLAIKFGIAKKESYESCSLGTVWDNSEYGCRITGISNESEWHLNQSKSNSYYEEESLEDGEVPGRFIPLDEPNDYSHNRERLLTIGVENESKTIKENWNLSYHIWGDSDIDLELTSVPQNDMQYVGRIWRMEKHMETGDDLIPSVSWGNFENLFNKDDAFFKNCDKDNPGIASSTFSILEDGYLKFSIADIGAANNSTIGFSINNDNFVNGFPTNDYCNDFVFAIRYDDGNSAVVYDANHDGYYDTEVPFSASSNQAFQITVEKNAQGNFEFSASGVTFVSELKCLSADGAFAKMIINGSDFGVGPFEADGFSESPQKGTNVEYSIPRIAKLFGGSEAALQNYTPVLLVDRNANGGFDFGNAEGYLGTYSTTPGTYADRIEFYGFEWDTDGSGADLFTLAFIICDDNQYQVFIDQCCDDLSDVAFTASGCNVYDQIYYEFKLNDISEPLIESGFVTGSDYVELGEHPPGEYILTIVFSNCVVVEEIIVLDDLYTLPDILFDPDIVECNEFGNTTLIAFDLIDISLIPFLTFDWTLPDGSILYDHFGQLNALEPGIYSVTVTLDCPYSSTGESCSVTDQIEVLPCCDEEGLISVILSEPCCNCTNVSLELNADCEGDYTFILYQNGGQLIDGDIENQVPLMLDDCFLYSDDPADNKYYVEFYSDGEFISATNFTILPSNFENIDLISGDFSVSSGNDDYCLLISDLNADIFSLEESIDAIEICDNGGLIDIIQISDGDFDDPICLPVGCYTVKLLLSCPDNLSECQIVDDFCIQCDDLVLTSLEALEPCCNCSKLEISVTGKCFDSYDYTIVNDDIVIESGTLTNGETYVTSDCYEFSDKALDNVYSVNFYQGPGLVGSETVTIQSSGLDNLDLILNDPFQADPLTEEYCFSSSDLNNDIFTLNETLGNLVVLDDLGNPISTIDLNSLNDIEQLCLAPGCYLFVLELECDGEISCTIENEVCMECFDDPSFNFGLDACCPCNVLNIFDIVYPCSDELTVEITGPNGYFESIEVSQWWGVTALDECLFAGVYDIELIFGDGTVMTHELVNNELVLPEIDFLPDEFEIPTDGDQFCVDLFSISQEISSSFNDNNEGVYLGFFDYIVIPQGQDPDLENIIPIWEPLCLEEEGCWEVHILVRCPVTGLEILDQNDLVCSIEDVICVVIDEEEDCEVLLETCPSDKDYTQGFCIEPGVPFDCAYSWILYDANGDLVESSGQAVLTSDYFEINMNNYPPGMYTVSITWAGNCPCDGSVSFSFLWGNDGTFGRLLSEDFYCENSNELIKIENDELSSNSLVTWSEIIEKDTLIILEGNISNAGIFPVEYRNIEGKYLCNVSDLGTNKEYLTDFYIVNCSEVYSRIQLNQEECVAEYGSRISITTDPNILPKDEYFIFNLNEINPFGVEETIEQGVLLNENDYIYINEIGDYILRLTSDIGFELVYNLNIEFDDFLPEELLEQDTITTDLSAGSLFLDASTNVQFDANYTWFKDGAYFASESTIEIVDYGEYTIQSMTANCIQLDTLIVDQNIGARVAQDGIKLRFANPMNSLDQNKIYIDNIPSNSETRIDIYDSKGARYHTEQIQGLSQHMIKFRYTPGIYFVRVQNSEQEITVKSFIII